MASLASAGSWYLTRPGQTSAPAGSAATGLATVVRTDLVTTEPAAGTIGFGSTTTITVPAGTDAGTIAQAQATVNADTQKLAGDQQAAVDTGVVDQQGVAAAQDAVNADQAALSGDQQTEQLDQQREQVDCTASATGQVCAADKQKVQSDAVRVAQDQSKEMSDRAALGSAGPVGQQKQHQADAAVAADQVALASAIQALRADQAHALHGGIYTGLPAVGTTISQGQALYSVDGHGVPLLYGPVPMYRQLASGVSGPDVQQLEQDLVQLGFASASDLPAKGTFEAADAAAVRRWQASLGVDRTGDVDLGDLVFEPGPLRVVAVHPTLGASVQGGQPLLDVTSTTRLVTVPLQAGLADSVRQGDAVTVDLPDGRTRTTGVVSSVSTVAQQSSSAQSQNGAPQSTILVTITLSDPSHVPDLDQAPVTVALTTQSARGVLAVPVNALLALEGGGYAVEVPDGRGQGTHLVAVQTGIFDNSQVQVSGSGLHAGMAVVVPR